MEQLIPEHVLLHALKHHLQTIVGFVRHNRGSQPEAILSPVRTMGASQFDLYTGDLPLVAIRQGVIDGLLVAGCVSRQTYAHWIQENNGYRTMCLSDGSDWTLRFIDKPDFIHVHPSRYSPHTLRIKANAMKSVLCYLLTENITPVPDLIKLNEVRTKYLQLSPLAGGAHNEEIRKVYQLLIRYLSSDDQSGSISQPSSS